MTATIWNPGTITTTTLTAEGTVREPTITLNAGQTVVNFSRIVYTLGLDSIYVYKNGQLLNVGQDYNESSTTSITLTVPAILGDKISVMGVESLVNYTTQATSAPEVAIAAAVTTNIGAANSDFVRVTGADTISSLGTSYQGPIFLRFTGVCTLVNSSALICPDSVNLVTSPGTTCIATPKSSLSASDGWVVSAVSATTPRAESIVFVQAGAGAVPTTVQAKLRETVSIKDFGAVGDGVTDDTTAVRNAINYCLAKSMRLWVPVGAYLITNVSIDNATVSGWSTLDIEGESFETGSAMSQTGYGRGATFVTNGATAFSIAFNNFSNESIRFKNVSFYNKGAIGFSCAIIIDKTTTNYPRGWSFEGMGYYNFDTCIGLRGNDASIFNNFFGPMVISKQFPYLCGIGLNLIDAYPNLCHIEDSLYFGCTKSAIVFAAGAHVGGSGGILSIRNTHFEGCEPTGIAAGLFTTLLTLDNVSGESTGSVSGNGIIKRSTTPNALTLTVSNSNYGTKGFSLMPSEYRLGTGDIITASCPVNVSGYGWITTTPAMVTPVVSNNATYAQTDKSTFGLTPVHSNVGRVGPRTLDKFGGWNSGAGLAYTPPNSAALPDAIRANFVGVPPSITTMSNISDTYTAPSNGYVYASWIANYSAANNGFWAGNSQMVINGVDVLTKGNSFGPGAYNFLVVAPIGNGQVLGRTELVMTGATTWGTAAYLTFESNLLNMFEAACGHPKSVSTQYSLLTANNLTVSDYGDGATPFAIRVQLFFNGGKYGFKEYLITGDGAVAANRVYTTVASSVVAGIAVTPNTGANAGLYDITVANTSGVTVSVTKIVTFIS